MNDKLKNFIDNLGVMCETWTLIYGKFLSQGMDAKDAMMHTQGFMAALVTGIVQNNGGNQ